MAMCLRSNISQTVARGFDIKEITFVTKRNWKLETPARVKKRKRANRNLNREKWRKTVDLVIAQPIQEEYLTFFTIADNTQVVVLRLGATQN